MRPHPPFPACFQVTRHEKHRRTKVLICMHGASQGLCRHADKTASPMGGGTRAAHASEQPSASRHPCPQPMKRAVARCRHCRQNTRLYHVGARVRLRAAIARKGRESGGEAHPRAEWMREDLRFRNPTHQFPACFQVTHPEIFLRRVSDSWFSQGSHHHPAIAFRHIRRTPRIRPYGRLLRSCLHIPHTCP